MVKFEFDYTEIDGLLYPNIEIDGIVEFNNLGKLMWSNWFVAKHRKCQSLNCVWHSLYLAK